MKHIWLMLVDSKAVKVPTIEGVTVVFERKVVNQFDPDKPKHLYVCLLKAPAFRYER